MKHLLSLLLLLLPLSLSAAAVVSGTVTDASGAPIPFATISLMGQDSTLMTGAISDENGKYSIETTAQKYILQASFVGYQTAYGGPNFTLKEETEQLEEVEVKAKRPLIERQFDKLVVNVSQSPLSAGSNGNEILRRAPGVRIDKDGNITVNGKGVEIYIDGKPSYLSGQQLKAMLDGTDGNTIEKIEIISNPSAKYDASGQGGIINIKLKRNKMQGLNGMLSAGYGGMYYGDVKRWLQMDMVSLNINYRTAKTYTFGQLTQVYAQQDIDFETGRTIPETATEKKLTNYSISGYNIDFQYYMFKVGNDWYIDSLNTVGFILQVPYMNIRQNIIPGRNYGYTMLGTDTVEHTTTSNDTRNSAPQHTANLNYTHTFSEQLERELTANIDYNRYSTRSHNRQNTDYGLYDLGLDINTRQIVDIYSAKLDFQTKFWNTGLLECGIKYALSSTDNHMTTDSLIDGANLSLTPSDFRYREHVAAAYITAAKQFGEHWSVKLGMRGEYTYSVGDWISADSTTTRSYFDPFPTAYWGYTSSPLGMLQQPVSVSMSYSRRIKRPNYYMLNPFVSNIDAYSSQVGNTTLVPEFNNDVEVHFSWTQYLNLTFNFAHTQNMFSRRVSLQDDGTGQMRWENFGTCTTHGGSISLTELPIVPKYNGERIKGQKREMSGAWLALTINAGWYHFLNRSYATKADDTPEYLLGNHYGYAGGTLSAYLPKDWVLSLDGNWSSPMTTGYSRLGSSYYMGFGARKMIMKHGLILNLNVQDLLRSMVFRSEDLGMHEGYTSWSNNIVRQQRIMLSVTWLFGQQQYTKRRNVGNLDESSRLGSGNNTGGMGN